MIECDCSGGLDRDDRLHSHNTTVSSILYQWLTHNGTPGFKKHIVDRLTIAHRYLSKAPYLTQLQYYLLLGSGGTTMFDNCTHTPSTCSNTTPSANKRSQISDVSVPELCIQHYAIPGTCPTVHRTLPE